MKSKEIWLDIEDHEGIYKVSSIGRVKSMTRVVDDGKGFTRNIPERILRPQNTSQGYEKVTLYSANKKPKQAKVHRLVALHFISNPNCVNYVDHIDGCVTNNLVSNLRWCTNRENTNYGMAKKKTTSKYPGVFWESASGNWRVKIMLDKKRQTNVGSFNCEIEAKEAYEDVLRNGIDAIWKYRKLDSNGRLLQRELKPELREVIK